MYFLKDKGCYYFPEIAPLYRTMRASDVDIDRFSFAFAGAKFDVVFAINRKPFELMFGCVGHGKCNFILTMEKGYMLSPISDEVFETLCRVLHLSYRGDRFTSYSILLPIQYRKKKEVRYCRTSLRLYLLINQTWRTNNDSHRHHSSERLRNGCSPHRPFVHNGRCWPARKKLQRRRRAHPWRKSPGQSFRCG